MQERATGDVIRSLRRKREWTQRQLAAEAGVPLRTLASYEGEGVEPPLSTAGRIAAALGVPVDALIVRPSVADDTKRVDGVPHSEDTDIPLNKTAPVATFAGATTGADAKEL